MTTTRPPIAGCFSHRRPGASIDDGVRSAARFRLGVRFLSREEAFVEGGAEAESAIASCAASAACLAARLEGVRVEYALLLVVWRVADEDLIALRVVRASSGEIVHRAVARVSVREAIAAATSSITASALDALGYAKGGELVVTARPANAELAIEGVTAQRVSSGRTILLPAGAYVVRASLADFEDASTKALVRAGATERVELELTPRKGLTDNLWFWIGVGVAATAVGVVVGVAAIGSDRCFCAAADPAQCGSCP
jgi:hypothetical protein